MSFPSPESSQDSLTDPPAKSLIPMANFSAREGWETSPVAFSEKCPFFLPIFCNSAASWSSLKRASPVRRQY